MRLDHEQQDCRFGNKDISGSGNPRGNRGINRDNTLGRLEETKQRRWDRKVYAQAGSSQRYNPPSRPLCLQRDDTYDNFLVVRERKSRETMFTYQSRERADGSTTRSYDHGAPPRYRQPPYHWKEVSRPRPQEVLPRDSSGSRHVSPRRSHSHQKTFLTSSPTGVNSGQGNGYTTSLGSGRSRRLALERVSNEYNNTIMNPPRGVLSNSSNLQDVEIRVEESPFTRSRVSPFGMRHLFLQRDELVFKTVWDLHKPI
ncbi:unnamed protein product [Arabis nemorensis]|uniref:Uncharacterized protein n=1 Tax=Arabis nemorensis TaxID=586526 RepID=A0A565CEF4_9BRAS|nr:unnamed protein product [Arabis nemorensis]